MLGSVFSPFYAAARARPGGADPLAHAAFNVALYARGQKAWALTERGAGHVGRDRDELVLGPNRVRWEGDALVVEFDERGAPIPRRIAGTVRLSPLALGGERLALDAAGSHHWMPIAPRARAEVTLLHPRLRFQGDAYLDANWGDEGLEHAFTGWSWSRVTSERRATVTYEIERRDGTRLLLARAYEHAGGRVDGFEVASTKATPTWWRVPRTMHGELGAAPRLLRTLEDTPFYARSLVETRFFGERATGTHESLSLDRFRSRIVQMMLPFRTRREGP
jgi:carotenoid 1,2-hydratase